MALVRNRRIFLRDLGLSAAVLPFLQNLPSLGATPSTSRKKRLIIMFSPNGVFPKTFWPEGVGSDFTLKESLSPLEPFKDRMLTLHGVCDKVRGDGDNHMRGIGCLLTGVELFPRERPGGVGYPGGMGQRSLDRPGDQGRNSRPTPRPGPGSVRWNSASLSPSGRIPGPGWFMPAPTNRSRRWTTRTGCFKKLYGKHQGSRGSPEHHGRHPG